MLNATERSAWSRHGPILEISDVNREEALKYLEEGRKVDKNLALQLYELTGGRMVHLEMVADNVKVRNMGFKGAYDPECYAGGSLNFSSYRYKAANVRRCP